MYLAVRQFSLICPIICEEFSHEYDTLSLNISGFGNYVVRIHLLIYFKVWF